MYVVFFSQEKKQEREQGCSTSVFTNVMANVCTFDMDGDNLASKWHGNKHHRYKESQQYLK